MRRVAILLALQLLILAFAWTALAQSGYGLSWWTVDGGGGHASGGPYTLSATSGQPDAGVMSGGVYTLGGGLMGGGYVTPPEYKAYLPLVVRSVGVGGILSSSVCQSSSACR